MSCHVYPTVLLLVKIKSFFHSQFSQQGLPSLEKMKLSAISFYIITNNKHSRIRTCILLADYCVYQGEETARFSLARLTSALGALGKICILTGSKLRKHDMESEMDCIYAPGVWFFNRLTFGIWGKSQQFSGQSFQNCPLGRTDMRLEAVLLHCISRPLACAYKWSCFLRPGNVNFLFLTLLPCLLPLFLWPLTLWRRL